MITRNVFLIRIKQFLPSVNVYLLKGESEFFLIDSGYDSEESIKTILEEIGKIGLNVDELSFIINTHGHPDHVGGNIRLKQLSNAKIAIHFQEVNRINRSEIDMLLKDGDVFDIKPFKIRVIHSPGHCQGHICFYDEKTKLLFSGDHIIEGGPFGTVYIGPPNGNVSHYITSLKKVLSLDMSKILPGHGDPIQKPDEKINEILKHHWMRERQIIRVLGSGEKNAEEISKKIYGNLVEGSMAKGAIIGRVEKLINDGIIKKIKRKGIEYYKLN